MSGALAVVRRLPLVSRVRRFGREVVWQARMRRVDPGRVPGHARSFLFICLGNICRSPFAAHLMQQRASALGGPPVRCASAGFRARPEARTPSAGIAVARRYGIDLASHRPSPLTRDLLAAHDVAVVMEVAHQRAVREQFPDLADRVLLLSWLDPEAATAFERCHIADPYGQPIEEFARCYARIERAVARVLASLGDGERRSA